MIVSMIRIIVPPEKKGEVLEILLSLKGPTEVRQGCVSCNIYQDLMDKNILFYKDTWENKESLYKHMRSNLYRDILAVIDMSIESPSIQFCALSHVAGMELIEDALGYA